MSAARMQLRIAESETERTAIYRLRYAVYVEEMEKPYPTANHAIRQLSDPMDETGTLLYMADESDAIVGSIRANKAADAHATSLGSHLQLSALPNNLLARSCVCSRLVLAASHRRRGAFWPLIRGLYRWAVSRDFDLGFSHASLHLTSLFGALGWQPFGEVFIDADAGSEQQPLKLPIRDANYLKSVRSPLVKEFEAWQRSVGTATPVTKPEKAGAGA